jgi:hypothetical protein
MIGLSRYWPVSVSAVEASWELPGRGERYKIPAFPARRVPGCDPGRDSPISCAAAASRLARDAGTRALKVDPAAPCKRRRPEMRRRASAGDLVHPLG